MSDRDGGASALVLEPPPISATLAANQLARERAARGEPVVHLGFGDAGLPLPRALVDALVEAAADARYGPVGGSPHLRELVAGFLARRGVSATAETVVVTPGSKAGIYAVALALGGDVVVTTPSWVSYAGHARLRERAVVRVPTPADVGGVPDPQLLREAVRAARARGSRPRVLFITNPDNPTGTLAGRELLGEVLATARELDLFVVADEIYQDLAHDPRQFVSAAQLDPDNVFATGGLSKSLALGGWRVGYVRMPQTPLGRTVAAAAMAIGSELWSCLPPPIAAAAEVGFAEPPEIVAHVADSRALHTQVVRGAHELVLAAGASCRPPGGAFYVYPDFSALAEPLAANGIASGPQLAAALLERFGVVVLGAAAFGESEDALRFRVATSMLYGATDAERWETLDAARRGEALQVPRIAAALGTFSDALKGLIA
ncbi:pyridoxal phosphate-dependent aminotransferase [Conexibacter sp. CPCC 206217]|uniref:pyridoxal phosphate-dependent aminotransferase n=1 Tax=Conexibacter sp. CPCC 206217 TaxID=3064574 RepID=UPI002724022F|nr:pyridoxal phosphate-dependent aminotransferase [Conexibacter sp. CPCC 206217]MDO8209621.1 pyridoxal phosphate-dependent aminotransferase [Conexibacter sp. CPCC 206217]